MRLEGTLDESVYEELAYGYDALGKGILEIAKSYWLIGDVKVLSRSTRNSVAKKWGSLAEYVRSEIP